MPWKECHVVEERLRFIARLLDGEKMAGLCREFGISRKTGYKIYDRYQDGAVKLTKSSSSDPQDTGLEPAVNPPCWGSETAVSLNLTVSIIPLPAEVAR